MYKNCEPTGSFEGYNRNSSRVQYSSRYPIIMVTIVAALFFFTYDAICTTRSSDICQFLFFRFLIHHFCSFCIVGYSRGGWVGTGCLGYE